MPRWDLCVPNLPTDEIISYYPKICVDVQNDWPTHFLQSEQVYGVVPWMIVDPDQSSVDLQEGPYFFVNRTESSGRTDGCDGESLSLVVRKKQALRSRSRDCQDRTVTEMISKQCQDHVILRSIRKDAILTTSSSGSKLLAVELSVENVDSARARLFAGSDKLSTQEASFSIAAANVEKDEHQESDLNSRAYSFLQTAWLEHCPRFLQTAPPLHTSELGDLLLDRVASAKIMARSDSPSDDESPTTEGTPTAAAFADTILERMAQQDAGEAQVEEEQPRNRRRVQVILARPSSPSDEEEDNKVCDSHERSSKRQSENGEPEESIDLRNKLRRKSQTTDRVHDSKNDLRSIIKESKAKRVEDSSVSPLLLAPTV
ncbi:hypothetical protein F2Q68_00025459 [Brassica cretica]|uniref:Uncharacterized protein n=1 Tax=Brassica cretica TaxID=69181 RepID=A0A8S9ICS9_BRACR|nr:hypothetical protein F2Q68_00025459 [Brassica cretica]